MSTTYSACKNATTAAPDKHRLCRFLTTGALLGAFLVVLPTAQASKPASTTELDSPDSGWVVMPAGAKQAYIGIHGGTVPVSLLATSEGTSLVSFVGRTGNDFLELLHREDMRMPSLLNGTTPQGSDGTTPRKLDLAGFRVRHLMAGKRLQQPAGHLPERRFARQAVAQSRCAETLWPL